MSYLQEGSRNPLSWQDLARQLQTETNEKKLKNLSFDSSMFFPEDGEARKWLEQFLKTPQAESLPHSCLYWLFHSFYIDPTREEIQTATKFWNKDHQSLIDVTSHIIVCGKDSLTPNERQQYVQKAKLYFDEINDTSSAYNDQQSLVKLVWELAGSSEKDWYFQIISQKWLTPTAEEALCCAVEIDPDKTAATLLSTLSDPSIVLRRKWWIITSLFHAQLIGLLETPDKALVTQTVTELTKLKDDDEKSYYEKWELKFIREDISQLLEKYPDLYQLLLE